MNYNDFFELSEIEGNKVTVLDLATLHVPTGKIVVCDPLAALYQAIPLERTISPGEYEVRVSRMEISGFRHAVAKLVITESKAVRWENAYGDETLGFPVDAGLGCFCDEESKDLCVAFLNDFLEKNPDGNIYDDYFAAEFKKNAIDKDNPKDIGEWLNFTVPDSKDNNIIMFNSGYGDGVYPCYWGIDATGEICELLIDFKLLGSD